MTTQTQISRPAPFIEDIGKDFAKSLVGVTGLPALAADISGQLTKRTDPATGELETDEAFQRRQDIARERFQTFQQTQAQTCKLIFSFLWIFNQQLSNIKNKYNHNKYKQISIFIH